MTNCGMCGQPLSTDHSCNAYMTTIKTLEEHIYSILYKKSKIDGVRVLYEDEWPIDELVIWIYQEIITPYEKRLIHAQQDGYLTGVTQGRLDEKLQHEQQKKK